MTRQLLFYESAVPLTPSRHGETWFEPCRDYAFSANTNSVPLMAVEFPRAAAEYAIVFGANSGDVLPSVVLGVRPDRNLYLSADMQWNAEYVPAFIRRYPFVFSAAPDSRTLTLCIDESYPGLNREGRGVRLFGDDGRPGAQVQEVLKFLQDYHTQFERTRALGNRLKELGLLEPMQARIRTPQGQALALGGFSVVSRARLRSLDGEALSRLAGSDELELLYLHLFSLHNFDRIRERLIDSLDGSRDSAPAAAPAA